MDRQLQDHRWIAKELKICYKEFQDGMNWPENYYLPDPPANFNRANYPIETLNVSDPWKDSDVEKQMMRYWAVLETLKSGIDEDCEIAAHARHYSSINFIDQLRRIKPHDIKACKDILTYIYELLSLILNPQSPGLDGIYAKVSNGVLEVLKYEQKLREMTLYPDVDAEVPDPNNPIIVVTPPPPQLRYEYYQLGTPRCHALLVIQRMNHRPNSRRLST